MNTLNCVLIGNGGVLVRCGEALMARGNRIRAVVTDDATARSWAIKSGTPHYGLNDLTELEPALTCDVLLSIGNYAIVPSSLLKCAKRMSVNYHYGPLPEYSGLHAPSWAIAERATDFAITWHRLSELVDGGDILKRVPVPVEPGETALSLGLKCDDAAVASVAELVDEIAEGRETATPQDLAARRYFSRHTQFAAEGLIDWEHDADHIVAMARATDFGPFNCPLVWPKVSLNGNLVAVRDARLGAGNDGAVPGEVIACDDLTGLQVATASGTVHLTRLSTLEGRPLAIGDLAASGGVHPGMILPVPAAETRARISAAGTAASKAAAYWRKRLLTGDSYRLPYAPPESGREQDARPVTMRCPLAPGAVGAMSSTAYLIGAWCTFLSRAAAKKDILIAVAAPRMSIDAEYRDLFTSWLPLRAEADTGISIADNLREIGREFSAGQSRVWLRRDSIGRDEALRELWDNGSLTPDVFVSPAGEPYSADGHRPVLHLAIAEDDGEDDGTVEFRFDAARVSRQDVVRLAGQFGDWCLRLPSIAGQPLGSADVVSAEERRTLIEDLNNSTADDTIVGHCLHRLFESAADAHGSRVAVVCADARLTYAELNARANGLARVLADRGTGRGDLVGVALDRSIDLVVALLAVMKTGAAYVPIDPGFPAGRIRQVIESADPKLVITAEATPPSLSAWTNLCLAIDGAPARSAAGAEFAAGAENLDAEVSADDLAYVIYTSGSTGTPKGVEISHGAVCNFLASVRQQPGCDETDRLLAVTTVSFDIAVLELFLPLLCGATTVIAQAHEVTDVNAMLASMKRHAITMMQGTPATWQLLLDSGWRGDPRLAKILCGGEALSRQLADRLLECGDSVWNMYGPTETTVWSSVWRVREGEEIVIGTPIANTQLYVLDEDLSPTPLGFPGELCIGGAGVARGYRNDPSQTRSRFAANPFGSGVLFRTGDLAVFREPGKLSVLGRNDRQVKLRGYRIELGDIESAITAHEDIARAMVVDRGGQLVAYCVRDPAPAGGAGSAGGADGDPQVRSAALAEWAGAWDRAYEADAPDAEFNLAGWHNSYDGLPFSGSEMRDWQQGSVRRILSYSPQSVFEIGSGTGLMLLRIAPHCGRYHAVDASSQAVEITRRNLGSLAHVTCECRPAHELPAVEEGAFDTVVINSVAQYFPGIDYLTSVLEWATGAVSDGRVFIGDLRDLSLLDVFHADVAQFRGHGEIPAGELARRAAHAMRSDRELVISPEYFANLPSLLPRVTRADIVLRDGRYVNEMTRYRYDVVLHVGNGEGEGANVVSRVVERNWLADSLDVARLPGQLAVASGTALRLNGIPNGRLSEVHSRVAAALGDGSQAPARWVDPNDLRAAAEAAGLEMALLPSRSGDRWSFDAQFWHAGETPDLSLHPARAVDPAALARYANVPAAGRPARARLSQVLRPWLAERLPGYMVPGFFVELDDFPLTPNGKIDVKALPDTVEETEAAAKPASELERDILAVWAEVLGHNRIGLSDNFFEIGGDSLRVVRLQVGLEQLLGRAVSPARLYEHYTVKALAAYLAGDEKPAARFIPPRRAAHDDDIAIIGMACRLPGGVTTPEEYWGLLERGGDGIVKVPEDRWDADALYDADPEARGKSYCSYGGFVTPIDLFDAPFFGISPREARALDPMQRMVLETCSEAFERAGYTMEQIRGSLTGAFIGVGKSSAYREYGVTMGGGLADLDGYVGPGSAGGTMSGRVSYVFGLEGPTMTVDTACSSSLVTTHLACNALRAGECDLALSAGVSLILVPELHVEFSRLRGMSPDGRCRSFSSDTEGTGWSEGAAAAILKRLSDAQRDGDPILAVLRGTAVNHDGHAASLTTPSGPAQQRVIRAALAASGLQPEDIDYVEAHGTGTKLGDPIEGTALAEVFGGSHTGAEPLWIGSVKSNLGHTQAAAGLAGVFKVVLAMQHNMLPRTLHVAEPSPAVDWKNAKMALLQQEQPWLPADRPRRAGVSSFGIGGTNAHVIIEEPPEPTAAAAASDTPLAPLPPAVPFLVSGFTDAALREQAENLHRQMGMNIHDRLIDVAYSLAVTRSQFRRRLVLMVKDKAELLDKLAAFGRTGEPPAGAVHTGDHAGEPRLAALFTGQGSQLPGMGKDVYQAYPAFREALDETAAQFTGLGKPLLDVMWADPGSEDAALLNRTDFTQPALFALEVALWRLWQSWGLQPELLLGHSIGELAAAHVAGIFDLPDACRLVAARGRLMQALPSQGAMTSLEANGAETAAALEALGLNGQVDIAGLNTPTQTVVSGDAAAVDLLAAHFAARDRKVKALTVSHAFHSHHMDGMLAAFRAVAETVRFSPQQIAIVSSLTGELSAPGELEQPGYWVRQVRQAVRFSDGMRTLHQRGVNTFLELGPHPVLSGMGAACLADERPVSWVPSLTRDADGASVIQRSLADLHVRQVPVSWRGYFAPFGGERVALPTYAFQRERYWFEPPASRAVGAGLDDTDHVLLGGGVSIAGTGMSVFTSVVAAEEPAWVQEHKVMDAVLMPGTAFFEAIRAAGDAVADAAGDATAGGERDVSDVMLLSPLVLAPGKPVRLQVTVAPASGASGASGGTRKVQVYSSPEGEAGAWQLHAEGMIVPASADADASVGARVALPPRGAEPIDPSALYTDLAALGYGYGPTFQGIKEAWQADGEVWAKATLPDSAEHSASRYGIHPALLDSAMHSLLLTQRLEKKTGDDLFVPSEVERLSLREKGLSEIWVRVASFELGDGEFWASLDIFNADGENVGRLHRLHARRVDRAALRRLAAAGVDRFQFDVGWRHVDTANVELGGSWGLLCPAGEVAWARELRTSLARAGIQVLKVTDLEDAEDLDGVLCLWDSDADVVPAAHEFSAKALAQLQAAAETGFQPPLVWVTRHAVGTDAGDRVSGLGAGPLWGLMRTARNEHPELALRLIDLGGEAGSQALAPALMLEAEPECALRQGQVLVPRLQRAGSASELTTPAEGTWQLEIAAKGRLDEPLTVRSTPRKTVAAGEIRAQVKASGVNFLDVLNALGMVEIPAFGLEFAGIVTEVGANVKDMRAGDRVLGLARDSFASEVVTDARQVVRIPENLSFEEAATIPMTFLTAWYGLHELGALRPGERVLIHSAAGGVGMAAVQLARLHGAEVYGTASEPKWSALRELGLDDDHIASSRDLGFAEHFGSDFNVVLNSLATEFIDASLGMLASGGRFLEMGKIDLREQSWIDDNYPGVTYTVYNLPEAGPDLTHEMLLSLAALFADGKLKPLPLRAFPITKTSDALRFMAQARHVGKVVLTPSERKAFIQPDGAVLITGGVGDLGRRVARWLASAHGVRDLVLTSRRGLDAPGAAAFADELAELGAKASVVACDSADLESVTSVLAMFSEDRPLRGVVHAAGVLDDGALTALTPERLEGVFLPKLDGAWHLHRLTKDIELDFFLMFSSIASVMGSPGQGNYAAANAFLDALAHLRRAEGLPATSVAWGPWADGGMAAGLSQTDRARFDQLGLDMLTSDEGLELFELAVKSGRPLTMAAALDTNRVQRYFKERGGIPPLFSSLLSDSAGGRAEGGGVDLRKLLSETAPEEHAAVVLAVVREEVAKTLGFSSRDEVDLNLPLQDIGIDSLTAVLMRNQLADLTGLALPAKIAFDHPNLKALGEFLLAKLRDAGLDAPAQPTADGAVTADAAVTAGAAVTATAAAEAPGRSGAPGLNMATVRKGYLDPELRFGNAASALASPQSVFVTGATGFVGAFLLHELLESDVIAYCLVRADDGVQALRRLVSTLGSYGLWKEEYAPLLNPVVGDLSLPLFGLDEETFDQLANQVDAICHSGALVDWMRPLDDYIGPNVIGAHEALRLASRGRGKAIHFMSTFATLPRYLGYEITEEHRDYGYLTSKWMAERMVEAACWRGARASVYRLPFVGASAGTGHFRLDRGDFLHNLIAGGIAMGSFPSLDADLAAVLPVDYLCKTIASVVTGDLPRIGKNYDFINPGAPSFSSFFELIGAASGGAELIPFDEWQRRARAHADAHPASPLARIAVVLDGLTQQDLEDMLGGLPVGDYVFGDDQYPSPPLDEQFVQRYVDRIKAEYPSDEATEVTDRMRPAVPA